MTEQGANKWLKFYFYNNNDLESIFAFSPDTNIGFVESNYLNTGPEDEALLFQNAASTFRHMTGPGALRAIFILADGNVEIGKAQAQGATLLPVCLRLPPFGEAPGKSLLAYNVDGLKATATDIKSAIRIACRASAAAHGIEFSKSEATYGEMMKQVDQWERQQSQAPAPSLA